MQQHQVVSRDEWLIARRRLLVKEKELTRLRDLLSAERRASLGTSHQVLSVRDRRRAAYARRLVPWSQPARREAFHDGS